MKRGCLKNVDPRAKIVIMLVISTLSILIKNIYFLSGVLLLTFILMWLFDIELLRTYRKIKRFGPVLLGLIIIQSIFSPSGISLITVKGISVITTGGIIKVISATLRIFTVITAAMFLSTSTYQEILLGLVKFGMPYEIAFMVLLSIRFLPVLTEEFSDALTAIQLRGVKIDRVPLGKKLQVFTYIFMPVVAGAILRAKKVSTSMEARAFRAYPKRTYVQDLVMTAKDYAVIVLISIFGISYFIFYITHRG